ncbi:MAG: hypothetical protein WKG07_22195, partial [Hymenobacter sp.]
STACSSRGKRARPRKVLVDAEQAGQQVEARQHVDAAGQQAAPAPTPHQHLGVPRAAAPALVPAKREARVVLAAPGAATAKELGASTGSRSEALGRRP